VPPSSSAAEGDTWERDRVAVPCEGVFRISGNDIFCSTRNSGCRGPIQSEEALFLSLPLFHLGGRDGLDGTDGSGPVFGEGLGL
jgi:hypothetical protein